MSDEVESAEAVNRPGFYPEFEELDLSKRKAGFWFECKKRFGMVALIEKTHDRDRTKSWEVVILRKDKEWEIGGNKISARENMPSNDKWGVSGWTETSLERGERLFVGKLERWIASLGGEELQFVIRRFVGLYGKTPFEILEELKS